MPWATVADNVALPLKLQGQSRDKRAPRVAEVLARACAQPGLSAAEQALFKDPAYKDQYQALCDLIKNLQGRDIRANDSMLACAKHFAAYGAAQAGRDYAAADLSIFTLRDVYLPPFKAAVESGVDAHAITASISLQEMRPRMLKRDDTFAVLDRNGDGSPACFWRYL